MKNYQRRYLRAPLREPVLYSDGEYVHKAMTVNVSEGGLLIDELPSFPETDEVSLMLAIPRLPGLRNFSLLKMQTFSKELFEREVVRARVRLVRRVDLAMSLENLFNQRYGLEFVHISSHDQRKIEDFVTTFSANLIYLQTLVDAFNTDDETKIRVRTLAKILGYEETEKISHLRALVTHDYKSLQWL